MKIYKTFIILIAIVFSCSSTGEDITFSEMNDVINSTEAELVDSTNSNPNENEVPADGEVDELSYLALGDSYTIGTWVEEKERWPVQLVGLLNKSGYNYTSPKIIAASGWTTRELDAAIIKADLKEDFNLVTLLIGVNNPFRDRSLDEFRLEFAALLEKAIVFGMNNPKNVIVVSIPDWGVTPVGQDFGPKKISREIGLFNDVKREESTKRNVKFINITEISLQALDNPIYVARDGLHFSGAMYKLWAEEISNNF